MNLIFILFVLLLLSGTGGLYFGGPIAGAGAAGLVLFICLAFYFLGGFRDRNV